MLHLRHLVKPYLQHYFKRKSNSKHLLRNTNLYFYPLMNKKDIPTEAAIYLNKINELDNQLKALKIVEETLLSQRRQLIINHNQTTKSKTKQNKGKICDKRGEEIHIGDKVDFNTKGKYHSVSGTVVRFTKHFVVSKDHNGNEIRRKPYNLLVLSKKQK